MPSNTKRASETALRAFCRFYVNAVPLLSEPNLAVLNYPKNRSMRKKSLVDQSIALTHMHCFVDDERNMYPADTNDWAEEFFVKLNNILIEYVANIKSQADSAHLSPATLQSYLFGLQRAFADKWGFKISFALSPIFNRPDRGVLNALDKKCRSLQAIGFVRESHNVLTVTEIEQLYASEQLSKVKPLGFMTRMIFNLAFMTAFRSSELYEMRIKDVQFTSIEGDTVIRIVGRIGSANGASKNRQGGLRATDEKAPEVYIWNKDQVGGRVNVFKDIEEYLQMVTSFRGEDDHFFASVNYYPKDGVFFFKDTNLGQNTIGDYVKKACIAVGVSGSGLKSHMTIHGLRGTVITRLFESGHADASISLRSLHRDFRSFKAYHNLRGVLGRRQQDDILGPSQRHRTTVAGESVGAARGATVGVSLDGDTEHDDAQLAQTLWARSGLLNFLNRLQTVGGNVVVKVNYGGQSHNA